MLDDGYDAPFLTDPAPWGAWYIGDVAAVDVQPAFTEMYRSMRGLTGGLRRRAGKDP